MIRLTDVPEPVGFDTVPTDQLNFSTVNPIAGNDLSEQEPLIDATTAQDYISQYPSANPIDQWRMRRSLDAFRGNALEQRRTQQDDHYEKLFTDENYQRETLNTPEFKEAEKYQLNPNDLKDEALTQQFLSHVYGKPVGDLKDISPVLRDTYAQKYFDKPSVSNSEFVGLVKKQYDDRKLAKEAVTMVPSELAAAMLEDVETGKMRSVPEIVQAWKSNNSEIFRPEWEGPLLSLASGYFQENQDWMRRYAPFVKEAYGSLAASTGKEGASEDSAARPDLISQMVAMPKADRAKAMEMLALFAAKDGDVKGYFSQLGESVLRGITETAGSANAWATESEINERISALESPSRKTIWTSTNGPLWPRFGIVSAGPELRPATKDERAQMLAEAHNDMAKLGIARELRQIAIGVVDPIKKISTGWLGMLEQGTYDFAGSAPVMALAAVPGAGTVLASTAFASQEMDRLGNEYPDMPYAQRQAMALISGSVQGITEKLQAESVFGRLPATGALFNELMKPSAGLAQRITLAAGLNYAEQSAQELTQNATPMLVDAISNSLGTDMPGWDGEKDFDLFLKSTPQTLVSLLIPWGIGTGAISIREVNRGEQFSKDKSALMSIKFSEKQADDLANSSSPEEFDEKFQRYFGEMSDTKKREIIRERQQAVVAANEAQFSAEKNTLIREGEDFVLKDSAGKELYRTPDEQNALIAYREADDVKSQATRRAVQEMISFFEQGAEKSGRNVNFEVSFENRTGQSEIDEGLATVEQIQDRMRIEGLSVSDPSAAKILGATTVTKLREDVYETTIQLLRGATPMTVVEESIEGFVRESLGKGTVTMDYLRSQVQAYEQATGDQVMTSGTQQDVLESVRKLGQAYFAGKIRDQSLPTSLKSLFQQLAVFFHEVFKRAMKLKSAISEGKIAPEFESFLAESVGIPLDRQVETQRVKAQQELIAENESKGTPKTSSAKKSLPSSDRGKISPIGDENLALGDAAISYSDQHVQRPGSSVDKQHRLDGDRSYSINSKEFYHGRYKPTSEFDPMSGVVWWTDDYDAALSRAGSLKIGEVVKANLSMDNPLDLSNLDEVGAVRSLIEEIRSMEGEESPISDKIERKLEKAIEIEDPDGQTLRPYLTESVIRYLKSKYDGLIFEDWGMDGYDYSFNSYLTFDPSQISLNKDIPEKSYSLTSQEQIDRVNERLGKLLKAPDERVKLMERALAKFQNTMREHRDQIQAMRDAPSKVGEPDSALDQIENDRLSQIADLQIEEQSDLEQAGLDTVEQFAHQIESAKTEATRKGLEREAKVRLSERRKAITQKYAEKRKALESFSTRDRQAARGLSKEGKIRENEKRRAQISRAKLIQAIGELDSVLSVLPAEIRGKVGGFATLTKIGQGETAIADFFVQRADMIERELERALRKEYDGQLKKLFKRATPAKDEAGKKRVGKAGAETHALFDTLKDAVEWDASKVQSEIVARDAQLATGELSADEEARVTLESGLIQLLGDWKNADAQRRAMAVEEASRVWQDGYNDFRLAKKEQRERFEKQREELRANTGTKGTAAERKNKQLADNGWTGEGKNSLLGLLNFEQSLKWVFGEDSQIATRLVDAERNADYRKSDRTQSAMDGLEAAFTKLAGTRYKGEQLRYSMGQPSMEIDGLKLSQLEAMTALLMWAQEDGKRHMMGTLDEDGKQLSEWSYKQDFIDQIEDNLTPAAKQIQNYIADQYAKEYAQINPIYRRLNGVNLPQVKNYAPITVSPMQAKVGEMVDPVTGGVMAAGSVTPGSLRTRGTATAEPEFRDALQVYIAHKKQMEHWMAYAPMIQEARALLGNREVNNSVKAAAGQEASSIIAKWLQYFAQGGNIDAASSLALSQGIGRATNRAAAIALVGRFGTLAVQSTQLAAGLSQMPTGAYLARLGKLMTGQLGWGASLNSPYIQRRLNEMPPIVRQAVEGLRSEKPNLLRHSVAQLGRLISGADALFTAGTFAIVHDYQLKQAHEAGLTGEAAEVYALNEAERVTDRVAQPTRPGARSYLENVTGNAFMKLGWAFASEARKNLALMTYATLKRPPLEVVRTIAAVWIVNAIMANIIRSAWKDARDDDDDEVFDEKNWDLKRLALAAATEPLQGIPAVGDAVEAAAYKLAGEYLPQGNLFSGISSGANSAANIPDLITGQRTTEEALRDVENMLAGFGILNSNVAAAASLSHIARDIYGVTDNAIGEPKD